jgi:potassium-transporting ATPase KdpC subunit
MKSHIRIGLILFVLFTILTGVVYPLAVTAIAQIAFPHRANGSVLERDGQALGSELIGQQFDDPRYFWGRPSATEKAPYDGSSSSGSNLGPTNDDLLKKVKERIETVHQAHPDQSGPVPVDLVTASASGLDPHISPAAAEYQVTRVAQARGMTEDLVRQLVASHTENRALGLLGEPRVNVLKLNLALDEEGRRRKGDPARPESQAEDR